MSADNVTADFKKKMHATLVAQTSAGCSLAQFCKDFQSDWKKPVKFYAEQFGFSTVQAMLKALPSEVRVKGDHVAAVMKEETRAVQDLIDGSQANKLANSKKRSSGRGPPPPPLFSQSMPRTTLRNPPQMPGIPLGFREAVPPNYSHPAGFGILPMLFPAPQNFWSAHCSNWPPQMANYGSSYHPNYMGPFNGPVLHSGSPWSSVNDLGPFGSRPPYNGPMSNVNALHSDYANQMHAATNLFATSNDGAGLGSSHISNSAAPPFWSEYFKEEARDSLVNEKAKREEPKARTVRNQLDGLSEVSSHTAVADGFTSEKSKQSDGTDGATERRKKKRRNVKRTRAQELEEGEIDDDEGKVDSDSDISLQDEEFGQSSSSSTYYSAAVAELDLGYDSKEENEECHTFLASVTAKRIPPNIHRIIFLLQKAGNTMLLKELQDKYEKQYSTKLTNLELRTVLGVPEAKNTLVAFQHSPLARLFKYEMTTTGSGVVKLIENDCGSDVLNGLFTGSVSDVSDFGRLSASTSTLSLYSKSSAVPRTPFGGAVARHEVSKLHGNGNFAHSDLADFGLNPSSTVTSGRTTPFSTSDTCLAPTRPSFFGGAEMIPLDEIPLPAGSPSAFATSDSTQALSRDFSSSSLSFTAKRELTIPSFPVKNLDRSAQNLLALASMAFDLATEELTLGALHRALRVQTSFEEFTYSPSQMLGYLLMFFDECFQVVSFFVDGKCQVGVVATDVFPGQKAHCLVNFPACLHEFPRAADSITVPSAGTERRVSAFVVHCSGVTEAGSLHFVLQLTSYENTRAALEQFLIDYNKILLDSGERPLSATMVGQSVYYRVQTTSTAYEIGTENGGDAQLMQRLRRCRVVAQSGGISTLECMDTGERISAFPEHIFEFSSALSTLPGASASTERFPALAIHCEFARSPQFDNNQYSKKMLEVFSKLIERRTPVSVQLLESFRHSDFMPGFKTRLFVTDELTEEKAYPDFLANNS